MYKLYYWWTMAINSPTTHKIYFLFIWQWRWYHYIFLYWVQLYPHTHSKNKQKTIVKRKKAKKLRRWWEQKSINNLLYYTRADTYILYLTTIEQSIYVVFSSYLFIYSFIYYYFPLDKHNISECVCVRACHKNSLHTRTIGVYSLSKLGIY